LRKQGIKNPAYERMSGFFFARCKPQDRGQGFHRIRYYGLLTSQTRAKNIARARNVQPTKTGAVAALELRQTTIILSAKSVIWRTQPGNCTADPSVSGFDFCLVGCRLMAQLCHRRHLRGTEAIEG